MAVLELSVTVIVTGSDARPPPLPSANGTATTVNVSGPSVSASGLVTMLVVDNDAANVLAADRLVVLIHCL